MKQFGRFLTFASVATTAAAGLETLAGNKKAAFELNRVHIIFGVAIGAIDLLVSIQTV